MRKILAAAVAAVCTCTMLAFSPELMIDSYAATTPCETYSGSNINSQNYSYNWADTIQSYLAKTSCGGLMRVQGDAVAGKILVEYFDSSYNILSAKTINAELPIFGAFYESDSNYYILSGQNNTGEDNSVEVYRITKYDKDWNRIASCSLYGANTYAPFEAGSARMDDDGKYLLIRTCHKMYKSSDGNNHQANVTIQVDMDSMEITHSRTAVASSSSGYISHSFNQFIKLDDGRVVAVDHGDAYPRSIALTKYKGVYTGGSFMSGGNCTVIDLVKFPGSIGNNVTGATVGGFEISDTAYLVAGTYKGDDNYSSSTAVKNIFVSVLPKDSDTPEMKWITSYTSGSVSTPHLVEIDKNSYILMWSYDSSIYYTKLDGNGNTVGSVYSMNGSLSDCVPIVYNGKLVWYTWKDETVTFYSIDISSLSKTSETPVISGHDFVTTNTAGSTTATQKCSKCGYSRTITVPSSFSMLWSDVVSGGYSNSYTSVLHPGKAIYGCPYVTQSVDNSDMVLEFSDPSAVTVEDTAYSFGGNNKVRSFVFNKPGTYTLKVYPKYNTSIAKTFTFTIKHDYTSTVTKAAACASAGVRTYTCSTCGDSYTEAIAATGHSYKLTSSKAATCTATGSNTYTCSACGASYTETVAKKAHTYSTSWTIDKEATCTAEGSKSHHCTVCGDKTDVTVIAKTAHSYKESIVAPTKTAKGYTLHTCTVCGDSYKDNYTEYSENTIKGTIKISGVQNGENVTISLINASGTKYTASVTASGTFSSALPDGTYTLKASKDGYVDHDYTITVKNGAVGSAIEVVLKRPGDVSGDGKITAVDSAMVNAYVMKTGTLDSYDQKVADVIGNDGSVTAVDCSRINAHVQKTNLLW